MNVFIYDNSFEGLLTAVYESFDRKITPDKIVRRGIYQQMLFENTLEIDTCTDRAMAIWEKMTRKLSNKAIHIPYRAFLSQMNEIELKIYEFIRFAFESHTPVESDLRDDRVLGLVKVQQKVTKEAMRMIQFVRFQKTKDDIYFATVEPDYDVLPLITDHFKDRFSDQNWLIYDQKRDYGIYYDKNKVQNVTITESKVNESTGRLDSNILMEEEEIYRSLWKSYYHATNTKARKNLKLQLQFMPRRYWKYLPEKQDDILIRN